MALARCAAVRMGGAFFGGTGKGHLACVIGGACGSGGGGDSVKGGAESARGGITAALGLRGGSDWRRSGSGRGAVKGMRMGCGGGFI